MIKLSSFKANSSEKTYNIYIYIYIKDNKIIVKVEAPGNNNIKSGLEISDEYNIIKSKQKNKQINKNGKLDDDIHKTREYGKFYLDLHLKTEEYFLNQLEEEFVFQNLIQQQKAE